MDDRKLVKDKLYRIDCDITDKSIDEAIEYLKKWKEDIYSDPKYIDAQIIFCTDSDGWGPSSDKEYLYIAGIRKENDAEYNARIVREEKDRLIREEYDRKQFELLKKKFENVGPSVANKTLAEGTINKGGRNIESQLLARPNPPKPFPPRYPVHDHSQFAMKSVSCSDCIYSNSFADDCDINCSNDDGFCIGYIADNK